MEVPLSSSSTVRLIIERIPFDLTETGLWNYLESKNICPLLDLRWVEYFALKIILQQFWSTHLRSRRGQIFLLSR